MRGCESGRLKGVKGAVRGYMRGRVRGTRVGVCVRGRVSDRDRVDSLAVTTSRCVCEGG